MTLSKEIYNIVYLNKLKTHKFLNFTFIQIYGTPDFRRNVSV